MKFVNGIIITSVACILLASTIIEVKQTKRK